MSFRKYFVCIAVLFITASCARTYHARDIKAADVLDDYFLIKEDREHDASFSYWKKGVNWRSYQKIVLEPVTFKQPSHIDLDALQEDDGYINTMTHADNARVKEMSDYRLYEALKKGFRMVKKPDTDTLLMQFTISNVEASTSVIDTYSSAGSSVRILSALKELVKGTKPFVGKTSIESKVWDSATGDLLMVSEDVIIGGKTLFGFSDEWGVEQAFQHWAIQLSYQLCQRQSRSDCQKPE
jgi:hypothetical protein